MDTYDIRDLGSTDGTSDGECEVLLPGDSLGYIYGIEVGCNEGNELLLYDGRVLGTKLCTYDGTYVGLS